MKLPKKLLWLVDEHNPFFRVRNTAVEDTQDQIHGLDLNVGVERFPTSCDFEEFIGESNDPSLALCL
jgi:hypothetical protein